MKTKVYITAVVAALTMAACQNEEELTSPYLSDPDAVLVNPTLSGLQTRANTEGNGDSWTDGDRIKVVNDTQGVSPDKKVAYYTYNGTTWSLTDADGTPSETAYLVWANGDNTFQAWYPATAAFDAFTLPAVQNTEVLLRSADWMTAAPAPLAKPDDKTLPLTFGHVLAKVTVTISGFNSQFAGTDVVSAPKFKLAGSELLNGVTIAGSATKIEALLSADAALSNSPTITAVLCPGKYTADTEFMTLTVGSTNLTVKVPDLLVNTGLETGKAYTFNLTVGKDKVEVTTVSVNDWNTAIPKGDNPTMDEEQD